MFGVKEGFCLAIMKDELQDPSITATYTLKFLHVSDSFTV